ncbi:Uncharacterized conserved protein, contains HEPN domain [Desulfurobacterium pacificum]|uniref:Uncharacterized conserved protein, contains HEPN domain n=1 Tax=Desulfurobacterium pacificum TaxID=240166 RepID=A0ABY1NT68_9BACT|nr:DUF86 domain-containing protein [Desulfurobacterium pacificum]SMP17500.1 Uncharacterized conserved protein, contains HEPN domain [Desulfurobacterium pacificum]
MSKKKSPAVYLEDILESIKKIEKYTKGMSKEEFFSNDLIIDGVIRNLEIIGEATKKLPTTLKENHSHIPWKEIAGMRDILIHDYSGVDAQVIWDTIKEDLPTLKKQIQEILKQIP